MNDITIKAKAIKRELWIFLGILIFSFALNIFAILHYKTSWSELYTHLHIVIMLSIVIYGIFAGARILYGLVSKMFNKKQTIR